MIRRYVKRKVIVPLLCMAAFNAYNMRTDIWDFLKSKTSVVFQDKIAHLPENADK